MDFNELTKVSEDVHCIYCGSSEIVWKGIRKREKDIGHIGFCKKCRKYFTHSQRKIGKKSVTEEILRQYVMGKTLRDFNPDYRKSTLHRQILREMDLIPSWEEATEKWLDQLQNQNWFKNLVADTTNINVGGEEMIYLHVADNYFKKPLIYTIIGNEDRECIARELRKLKDIGYYPDVATIDLAPELSSAIEEVYRWAKIQGCVVHLARFLKKYLKTEGVAESAALTREKAKNLILHTACADVSTRRTMTAKLMTLRPFIDARAKGVVSNFLNRYTKLYHTLEELNGHAEALTTNLCERHIGLVKEFKSRLCGFKSFNTAQKLLNTYWYFYMKKNYDVAKNDLKLRRVEGATAFLLDGHISISRLSDLLHLPEQRLIEIAKKKGKTIILGYPISRRQIQRILELAPKVENLGELSEIMALNPFVIKSVLNEYGFRVKLENPQLKLDKILNFDFYEISNARIITP